MILIHMNSNMIMIIPMGTFPINQSYKSTTMFKNAAMLISQKNEQIKQF